MASSRPEHVPGTQSDRVPGPQRTSGGPVATGTGNRAATSSVRDRKEVRNRRPEKPRTPAAAVRVGGNETFRTSGVISDPPATGSGTSLLRGTHGPAGFGVGESHGEDGAEQRARPAARALLAAIAIYQAMRRGYVSPCRFYPSCSDYASEAIRTHGAAAGSSLAARRLLRCRPGGPSGYDPVPDPEPRRRGSR